MSKTHRRVALVLAIAGTAACLVALGAFFREFIGNRIPWRPLLSAREHYLAVGNAFSRGFTTGFFLCFFLVLTAIVVGASRDNRRRVQGAAGLD